jgi:hypothetical protein
MQGAHAGRLIIFWIENAAGESVWQVNPYLLVDNYQFP